MCVCRGSVQLKIEWVLRGALLEVFESQKHREQQRAVGFYYPHWMGTGGLGHWAGNGSPPRPTAAHAPWAPVSVRMFTGRLPPCPLAHVKNARELWGCAVSFLPSGLFFPYWDSSGRSAGQLSRGLKCEWGWRGPRWVRWIPLPRLWPLREKDLEVVLLLFSGCYATIDFVVVRGPGQGGRWAGREGSQGLRWRWGECRLGDGSPEVPRSSNDTGQILNRVPGGGKAGGKEGTWHLGRLRPGERPPAVWSVERLSEKHCKVSHTPWKVWEKWEGVGEAVWCNQTWCERGWMALGSGSCPKQRSRELRFTNVFVGSPLVKLNLIRNDLYLRGTVALAYSPSYSGHRGGRIPWAGGRGCSELWWRRCTPAWAAQRDRGPKEI